MTDKALILLYAKDRLVGYLGTGVKYLSNEIWEEYIIGILNQIEDSDIPRIKEFYELS